jgi:hypothetical protein
MVDLINQGACGCLGYDSGDSAHGERESHAFFVPPIAGKIDREEWPDSRLNVSEKEIQPVQPSKRTL